MDKFKMVPVEPTEAMLKAMAAADQGAPMFVPVLGVKLGEYRAALEAAPAPQVAFDEAAELILARHYWPGNNGKVSWEEGWLACARLKAGQPS